MKLHLFLFGSISVTSCTAFQITSTVVRAPSRISATPFGVSATISIDENAERDIEGLYNWASQNGVSGEAGFCLTENNGDWSVSTTEPLKGGTSVLSVPSNLIISSSRSEKEVGDISAAMKILETRGVSDQNSQFYLVLKILKEYENGEQSLWYPWMQSLPRLFTNSASMTEFCYECLPPFVASLSKIERIKFECFFEAIQQVEYLRIDTRRNRDLVKWAFNVVYTRCWGTDGGETQIVPMADMFNHGHPAEVIIGYDNQGNCNMYLTADVQANSPLRLSYGSPTNPSRLLATFGFLDESSPATYCKIMTANPSQKLVDMGYDFSRMLFFKDDGGITEEVWDVMLYTILDQNPELQDVQESFYQAHMAGDSETKELIHGQYFLETAGALKNHVDSMLLRLDELQQKTAGVSEIEHPRIPIIRRHNDFVKETFVKVKAGLDPMVTEETERRMAEAQMY